MNSPDEKRPRLLLHACCGPCSLEPSRLLKERGEAFDIFYSNSNIAPENEYSRRLETLNEWACSEGIDVIEGHYDHDEWRHECKEPFEQAKIEREERCRRCYRLRFEETARYASENGYYSICTTLSVSPYQYTDIIKEELERACAPFGLKCVFEDFRPYYSDATKRSKEAGMYRQNYCGCEISVLEAQTEREERRKARKLQKEIRRKQNAEKLELEREKIDKRKEKRRLYDEKQAKKRMILKRLRMERAKQSLDGDCASGKDANGSMCKIECAQNPRMPKSPESNL